MSANGAASCFDELKNSGQAEQMYRRAIEVQPDNATAHLNMGHFMKRAKRNGEAVKHYKRFLELEQTGTDAIKVQGIIPRLEAY